MAGKGEPQTNCNRNVFNIFVVPNVMQTTYKKSYIFAFGEIGNFLN